MTKEYYKNLIDKYLEEDILNRTDKLNSVSALWRSDSEINCDDRQELIMYIANLCIDNLMCGLDKMISNPIENSTSIDNMINIIDTIEKSSDLKDRYKFN